MTDYRNSRDELVPIETMEYSHLCNALGKLLREEPDRVEEIAAMEVRKVALEVIFTAHRFELEGEGYFSIETNNLTGRMGFQVYDATGEPVGVDGELATWAPKEHAAWAKAWTFLRGDAA